MDKNIRKRISKYNPEFDISTQKAELLLRSQKFQTTLESILDRTPYDAAELHYKRKIFESKEQREGFTIRTYLKYRKDLFGKHEPLRTSDKIISANNIEKVDTKDYTEKIEELYEEMQLSDPGSERSLKVALQQKPVWESFCKDWNIQADWDGNKETLSAFLIQPVELIYVKGKKGQTPELMLRITEWTTLDDIKKAWNRVEKYQKEMIKKWKKKPNFTRDLRWFDQAKEQKLKPRQIAEIWIEEYPEEIDLLVMRRIKKKIQKQDLQRRSLDDVQMLHEIRSGFLKEKYEAVFDEERDFYITGETGRGKFNPPFIDVIKKSIKRMEEQVALIDSYPGNVIDIAQTISAGLTWQDRFFPLT